MPLPPEVQEHIYASRSILLCFCQECCCLLDQEICASSLHLVAKSNFSPLHLYTDGISIFNFF